ncbi:MAG: tetratricopeptide repeat protein, partial [Candidatus Thorarchaeota archaeon]
MSNSNDIEKWKKILEENGENLEALANLGLLFAEKGEFSTAESYFRRGLDFVPNDTWFLINLGTSLQHQEKYLDAEEIFNQILKYEPDNIETLQKLALTRSAQGNSIGAISTFEKILELNPEDYLTLLNIGSEYSRKEEFSNAEGAFRKAIAINPQFLKAYMNLCKILELSEQKDELKIFLSESIAIFPFCTYFIKILYRLNNINFYIPVVYQAKIESQYELDTYRTMIVSEIVSWGSIKYKYLLYLYKENQEIPCFYVSLEENNLFDIGGEKYFFCAFKKEGHVNYAFLVKFSRFISPSKKP